VKRAQILFIVLFFIIAPLAISAQNTIKSKLSGSWICSGKSIEDHLMKVPTENTEMITFYENHLYQRQSSDSLNKKDVPNAGKWKIKKFGHSIKIINYHSVALRNQKEKQKHQILKFNIEELKDTSLILSCYQNGIPTFFHYKKLPSSLPPVIDYSRSDPHIIDMGFKSSDRQVKNNRNPNSTYKLRRTMKRSGTSPHKPVKMKTGGA
jgi:hypothetical protein